MERTAPPNEGRWLNRTTVGVGLTSLFSDWSHEIATTVFPAFLASLARRLVLAAGYGLAAVTATILVMEPESLPLLAVVFVLGGVYVGVEEALEDSLAAELVPGAQHGMAFGTLAAVNVVGDLVSSLMVGLLWSMFSPSVAFGMAAVLFVAGAVLVLRLR